MRKNREWVSSLAGWRRYAPLLAVAIPLHAHALAVCPSTWYVSYGGSGSYTVLNTDPDNLPLSALRFGRTYNDPTDLSRGYLDFNRDGKSDVFSAVSIGGGLYQWRYASGGKGPWINLAFDDTSPDQLRFGDFNGDGYTDVFSTIAIGGGNYQWRYSSAGTASYKDLAYDNTPPDQLRFGDFNGDGGTDVFSLVNLGAGSYGWRVSFSGHCDPSQPTHFCEGGSTPYVQINSAPQLLSQLAFGDVNGDGHTDVFTTVPDSTPGNWDWYYSSAGSGAYQSMLITNLSLADLTLAGDFNGDHRTDFFFTTLRQDGNYQWWYFYYKTSPFAIGSTSLAYDATLPQNLRFADFDGDGVTDIFTLVPCDRIFGSDFE